MVHVYIQAGVHVVFVMIALANVEDICACSP
jgi:hypothetical protein